MTRVAFFVVLAGTLLVSASGCQSRSAPPDTGPPSQTQATADRPPSAADPASTVARAAPDQEFWDAIFFEQVKVGYVHTTLTRQIEDGRPVVHLLAESELKLQRFGQTTTQALRYRSIETPTGEVLRFDSAMSSGSSDPASVSMQTEGVVRGDMLELRISTLGKTQTATVAWNPQQGGYFALEQSLMQEPMKPGSTRSLQALMAGFNQTAQVELAAREREPVAMLDGELSLLKIDARIQLGQNALEQTLWTNEQGHILKSHMPALNQTSYRVTEEQALAAGGGTFDLGTATIVPVDRPLERPHGTSRVVYRARFKAGRAENVFWQGTTQKVRTLSADSLEIVVRSPKVAATGGDDFPADEPPTPTDSTPNSLIQSDHPAIAAMAAQVAGSEKDPGQVARALERHVHQTIRLKDFSQALASAAEVVESLQGDCTEHSVLLAALCRARQIPARVAIGLVYHAPSRGFAYHMWTVAHVNGQWLPLDATLGQGGIGAAHLTVAHSNLEGVDPLSHFLPVVKLVGNLELSILEVE